MADTAEAYSLGGNDVDAASTNIGYYDSITLSLLVLPI